MGTKRAERLSEISMIRKNLGMQIELWKRRWSTLKMF